MNNPIAEAFLRSAVFPAAVATVAVFVTGKLKDPLRARLHALIVGLAFFAGSYLLLGRMNFPPKEAFESIAYAGLACAAFVILFPFPKQAPYILRAVIVFLLGLLLLWHIKDQLNTEMYKRNMIAFFCLGLGTWSIYERQAQKVNMLTLIGLPLITCIALSLILLFSASASFSQQVAILCALLGGMAAVALVSPGFLSKGAFVPFVSILPILIMAAGHFYLQANPWTMVALCIPYLLVWIRGWLSFLPVNPILEFVILAIAAILPLAYFVHGAYVKAGPLY